ncbi:MAG: type II toxin-antitoxin system HipA family toxin [Tannerella sp.]|jgi:serine/threonine-protein kinase HipA|nr:type II toxin-antitoxin system HipA family toxin [Tannerella sp.]
MLDAVEIKIWGQSVGMLIWHPHGYSVFRFNPDFVKLGFDLAPLLLPLHGIDVHKPHSFMPENIEDKTVYKALPHFIADSLPDSFGNRVIDEWLTRQGRTPGSFSPLERLCYTGKRGAGALEFYPPSSGSERVTDIDIERLVRLAHEVFAVRKDFTTHSNKGADAMKDIIRVGASAGGARPKAVIAYNEITGEIKSGQIAEIPEGFEHWLIKLDGVSKSEELGLSSGMGRVEYAYHLMARDCGISMAECRLLEEGSRAHFMTRRFDRPGNGEKLHLQSLNAIAGMNYSLKYAFSYESVFAILRRLTLPYPVSEQFFKRMVFNVAARNCDDHTKNVSFLMDKKGKWSLSPAYDVSYAYDPTGRWTRDHFLSINGKYEGFKYDDLAKVAKVQRIRNCKEIIEQVCEVVIRWPEYAKSTGVDKSISERIGSVHETHINMRENATIVKPSSKLQDATQDLKKKNSPKQSPNRKMKY